MGDNMEKISNLNPSKNGDNLAEAIVKMGNAAELLLRNGLNKRAIIILLQATTKIPQRDIKAILEALPMLEKLYCNSNVKNRLQS